MRSSRGLTPRQRRLKDLIEQVREVVLDIRFQPPMKGRRDMVKALAAMLDYHGIKPPYNDGPFKCTWLLVRDGLPNAGRLRNFLKNHLPEFMTTESPVLANPVSKSEPVSKPVSKKRLAKEVSKSEQGSKADPADSPNRINGWSIRKDRHGYYRAYRKIDGKTNAVYLGKSLDHAREKLGCPQTGQSP